MQKYCTWFRYFIGSILWIHVKVEKILFFAKKKHNLFMLTFTQLDRHEEELYFGNCQFLGVTRKNITFMSFSLALVDVVRLSIMCRPAHSMNTKISYFADCGHHKNAFSLVLEAVLLTFHNQKRFVNLGEW